MSQSFEQYVRHNLSKGVALHTFAATEDANGNLRITVTVWHGAWQQLSYSVNNNALTPERRAQPADHTDMPAMLRRQAV